MFGDSGNSGNSGPFGTSYNTSTGVGQVPPPEADYSAPEEPPDAPQAGAPAPQITVGQDVEQGVTLALQYARTATNRLVNIPPPGAIIQETRTALLEAYATIEEAARQIIDAMRSSQAGFDLARETTKLQEDVQGYVQAVEEAIAPYANASGQPSAGGMLRKPNLMLLGALAAGIAVVGFATYRAQQGRN